MELSAKTGHNINKVSFPIICYLQLHVSFDHKPCISAYKIAVGSWSQNRNHWKCMVNLIVIPNWNSFSHILKWIK